MVKKFFLLKNFEKKFFLFKNFEKKFSTQQDKKKIAKILKQVLFENNENIKSLGNFYKNNYNKKKILKYKKKISKL